MYKHDMNNISTSGGIGCVNQTTGFDINGINLLIFSIANVSHRTGAQIK